MDDVRYKSTDKVMSEYQWLRKGFFIKDTAVGIDGWNNRFCTYPLTRFTADEVYEDTERAKERLSKIRHEYYIAAREKKKYWDWFEEFREDMKTQYQWFHEENRVPLETAKWYNGESLNKRYNTSSFGSDYYCHRDDTKRISIRPLSSSTTIVPFLITRDFSASSRAFCSISFLKFLSISVL